MERLVVAEKIHWMKWMPNKHFVNAFPLCLNLVLPMKYKNTSRPNVFGKIKKIQNKNE